MTNLVAVNMASIAKMERKKGNTDAADAIELCVAEIERLAGALEPFAKRADRVATLGVTETDPLPAWLKDCQAARRALKTTTG